MLILTRRVGEKILIGRDIEVSVQRISSTQVSLGISAPHGCTIMRAEIRQNESFGSSETDGAEGFESE